VPSGKIVFTEALPGIPAMKKSTTERGPNVIEQQLRRVRRRALLLYLAFLILSVVQLATLGRFPINAINGGPWLIAGHIWSWHDPTVTPPHVLDILTVPIVATLWWPLLLLSVRPQSWSEPRVGKITKIWLMFAAGIYVHGFVELVYLEFFFEF
jgi:predicted nucleic acid-binding Zn ribbon protein